METENPILLSNLLSERDLRSEFLNRRGIIAVTVGSFAPVHQGHVDMLRAGVDALLDRGFDVRCIVIAPNRDRYVQTKFNAEELPINLDIDARIEMAYEFLPARLPNGVRIVIDDISGRDTTSPRAFTQLVTGTLEDQGLKTRNISIILGSDNVQSLESHVERHNTVCVTRVGFNDKLYSILHRRWVSKALAEGRLIITDRSANASMISSTEVRAAMRDTMDISKGVLA